MAFRDRTEAGRLLGGRLVHLLRTDAPSRPDDASKGIVVLGLPRGGVPVAAEIARALGAELDVIVVRKLGVPIQPELAMGAIGEDGARFVNDDVVTTAGISRDRFDRVEAKARTELDSRVRHLRSLRARVDLTAKTAIIVDDGMATGSTAMAACRVARAHGATRVVVAVPVAPPETLVRLSDVADEVLTLCSPSSMTAIGEWYRDFSPTSEAEVDALLLEAQGPRRPAPTPDAGARPPTPAPLRGG